MLDRMRVPQIARLLAANQNDQVAGTGPGSARATTVQNPEDCSFSAAPLQPSCSPLQLFRDPLRRLPTPPHTSSSAAQERSHRLQAISALLNWPGDFIPAGDVDTLRGCAHSCILPNWYGEKQGLSVGCGAGMAHKQAVGCQDFLAFVERAGAWARFPGHVTRTRCRVAVC